MLKKLLIVPFLILAGCGVTQMGKPVIDGHKVRVEKIASIRGAPEYYSVGVLKVPYKLQKSVALAAIQTVDTCEIDRKTLRFVDLRNRTLGTDDLTPTIAAMSVYVSTVCQMANNTQE